MPIRKVFRFRRISELPVSVVTLCGLLLCAALPSIARADSKRFVTHARGNAFDAAAAAAAQSANPAIVKMPVEEAGLVTEDHSLPNRAPALWSDSSSAPIYSHVAGFAATSNETPLAYAAPAYDNGLHRDAQDDVNAPQFATMFYVSEGFYFYPAAPGVASGAGSDQIDLGVGHPGQPDVGSADGPGGLHNGVAPRVKWPFRILSDQPVPVPEPSSLLLFACGVFAVGLRRKL
jgi:PEP-CTERM motif